MSRIAIIGAGELGQQIAHLGRNNAYNIVGFFDDWATVDAVAGLPVFGKLSEIDIYRSCFDVLVMGIGYKHFAFKEQLFSELSDKYEFATLIDKSAIIDPSAVVGSGSVIYPNVVIDKDVRVGRDTIVNLSTNICHNSIIGDHCYLSPAVNLAGYVIVGKAVFIGIGATVVDHLSICDNATIGAQSLVLRSIDSFCSKGSFAGIPAREL